MNNAPAPTRTERLQGRYPALAYPNYRLWFTGQIVSLFGTWMQMTAQGYLVFQLTQSPVFLGYVSFAHGLPTWLFTLYGGVIADRLPRRNMLMVTQACSMTLAGVLALLTFSHVVQPWHIVVLAFLSGTANAFDAPARQAFTLEMVERKDLANAIALNSTMFNSATALGPAIGGLTYSLFGPGWCFLINAVSYVAVLSALARMKLKPFVKPERRHSTLVDLKEGLSYIARQPTIRTLMFLAGCMSLFAMSFATLMPAWAVRILGGDATTNGLLQSARGAGALISAFTIASLGRFTFKGKMLTAGTLALPIMLLIFSQVRWLPLSLVLLVTVGLAHMPILTLTNVLVQSLVPDHLRGRVMGVHMLVFMGMFPMGGLWAGALAQRIGSPMTIVIGASIALAISVGVCVFFPKIRALE